MSTASKAFVLAKVDESLKKMKTTEKVALLPTLRVASSPNYLGSALVPLLTPERLGYEEYYTDHSQKAKILWYASGGLGALFGPKVLQKLSQRWIRLSSYLQSGKTNTIVANLVIFYLWFGTMTAFINTSYHTIWDEKVSGTGFVNYDLRNYSSIQMVSRDVASERLVEYFNRHPEELDERILSFLREHSEGDVFLWHDLNLGRLMHKDLF